MIDRYMVECCDFSGGYFKTFFFKYFAVKFFNSVKYRHYRVNLFKGKKRIDTCVNENLRPKQYT